MLKLAFVQLRTQFRRTLAVVVAIVLGVSFFSAAMMSGTVITGAIRAEVGNQLRGADLVVMSEFGGIDPSLVDNIAHTDGVREVEPIVTSYGTARAGGTSTVLRAGPAYRTPELREELPMKAGRLPESAGEVALTEGAASSLGLGMDEEVVWSSFDDDGSEAAFTVVGLVKGGNAFGTNLTEAFLDPATFSNMVPDANVIAIVVQSRVGMELGAVQSHIDDLLPGEVQVLTFDQLVDAEVASMEQGSRALSYGLSAFALIALFVAGIVISNTFAITLAQRTGELAMMRCIGAERRQILRAVLIEALVLGLVASVTGVILAFALVSGGSRLLIETFAGMPLTDVPVSAIGVPVVAGIAVTLLSAIVPARHATQVHPVQALRQADAPVESSSAGILRIGMSVLLVGAGIAIMLGGMILSRSMEQGQMTGLLVGMAGGAMSFLGLLLSARFIVPSCVRILGIIGGATLGVPAKVASANAMRNARRTAATSSALMMGVTLITMITVGAASLQATGTDIIDQQEPVDLDIRQSRDDPSQPVPQVVFDGVAAVEGVRTIAPIYAHEVQIAVGGDSIGETALAIAPDDAKAIARSGAIFEEFEEGTAVVPAIVAESYGIAEGDALWMSVGDASIPLTATIADLSGWDIVVTPSDLTTLVSDIQMTGAWVRLHDDANVTNVMRDISESVPSGESVMIQGGAQDRATYLELVDQMLLITAGLLGVAVIIAIVGVGNTLTLSVLERTRESGMLRAMGMTAAQLRETLAIEGLLIAVVGGFVGLVAGTIYGWIGAITLFGSSWNVSLGFPIGRLVLILGIAALAGILASVLPARRAVSISPVDALATV